MPDCFVRHFSVNLGGYDILVAKQPLNDRNIHAAVKRQRRKRMTQQVRMHPLIQTGPQADCRTMRWIARGLSGA